jgi:alkanesulfonate monooxygenase SsuD/methylene tetrahydromethanopterin reductase-like flavin-dependent oxidoreductase (luciferase family)
LRLGTLVSPATFRLPGLLANAAATVDHISGGRIELGIGAGWMEREHRAYGFPFPETKVRLEMFAEQLGSCTASERGPGHSAAAALHARSTRAAEARATDAPPLTPRRRHARSRAASRFADEQHAVVSPDDFARIRARVEKACESSGRTLRFSTMTGCVIGETREEALERARQLYGRMPRDADFDAWVAAYAQRAVIGSVDEIAERLRHYERAGCERAMLQHLAHTDLEPVRLIGLLREQLV